MAGLDPQAADGAADMAGADDADAQFAAGCAGRAGRSAAAKTNVPPAASRRRRSQSADIGLRI